MQTTKQNDNSMECLKSTVILNANNNRFSFVVECIASFIIWIVNTMRCIRIPFSIHLINCRDGKENKTRRKAIETDLFMVFIVFEGKSKLLEKRAQTLCYLWPIGTQKKPNRTETTATWKDHAKNKWNWKNKNNNNKQTKQNTWSNECKFNIFKCKDTLTHTRNNWQPLPFTRLFIFRLFIFLIFFSFE